MIAVECFPDAMLVRSMGIPVARITHQKGKRSQAEKDRKRSEVRCQKSGGLHALVGDSRNPVSTARGWSSTR